LCAAAIFCGCEAENEAPNGGGSVPEVITVNGTVTFDGDDGVLSLVYKDTGVSAGANRAVSGFSGGDLASLGAGVRNIFQIIAVEDGQTGKIAEFDEASEVPAVPGSTLQASVRIRLGYTYHFLVLLGHK
jgi:hypothetical protein